MTVIGRIQHQGNMKPQQRTKMPNTSFLKLSLGRARADRSLQNSSSLFQRDKSWNTLKTPPRKSHMFLSSTTKWQSQKLDNPWEHRDYTDFPWKNPEIQLSFTHLLRHAPAVLNKWLKAGEIRNLRSLPLTHVSNHAFTSTITSLRTSTMHHFRKVPSSHYL